MDPLPVEVYSAASVRAMDRRAIEEGGIPGYTLMQRAGEAALAVARRHWPAARTICVLCGAGNNAGDGYVVARLARAAGLDVRVATVSDPRNLRGDAAQAHADFAAQGGRAQPFEAEAFAGAGLVVDALLGTGVDRPLEGAYADAIRRLNARAVPVLALDMPSGIDGSTGEARGIAVRATRTIAFLALKSGYYLGDAPDHVGTLDFAGLDVPDAVRESEQPVMRRIDGRVAAAALPPRRRSAHKGDHGRVLVVGGHAMPGAARLAGEAALRSGAGLVTVATAEAARPAIVACRPEIIAVASGDADALARLAAAADAVAVGPGLGTNGEAARAFDAVAQAGRALVVDADALTLLAARPRRSDAWILTPHPGEAARLLGSTVDAVQRDRLAAARAIVGRFGGTCVLKGAHSLVDGSAPVPWVCDRGNPGMATAGSGDVLTGVIAALLAATGDAGLAAAAGVFLHAEAGDRAARAGMRGMIAGDIVAELRGVVNSPWS
jgi:NAD(P)H-hydrate epimerase